MNAFIMILINKRDTGHQVEAFYPIAAAIVRYVRWMRSMTVEEPKN